MQSKNPARENCTLGTARGRPVTGIPAALDLVLLSNFLEVLVNLSVVIEPSGEGGYTAHVPSFPGCISEGDSKEEVLKNTKEAIELYLEIIEDDAAYGLHSEIVEVVV